jgi:hypothetical protein
MNRSDDLMTGGPSGTPNPYWKRAFEEAAESPPPRVWDAVERQLDLDDEDGIIPLWQHRQGQQSMLFGRWVAGIAASLLLLLGGWWVWHRDSALRPGTEMASAKKASPATQQGRLPANVPAADEAVALKAPNVPASPLATATYPTRARRPLAEPPVRQRTQPSTTNQPDAIATRQPTASDDDNEQVVIGRVTMSVVVTESMSAQPVSQPARTQFDESIRVGYGRAANAGTPPALPQSLLPASGQPVVNQSFANVSQVATPGVVAKQSFVAQAQPMASTSKPAQQPAQAYEAPADAALAEVAVTKQQSRRAVWVSAGMTASAFDPAIAARPSVVPSLAFANSIGNNQASVQRAAVAPSLEANRGAAVAFQAAVGVPLGEHWAIETGVGYLSSQAGVASANRLASASAVAKSETGVQTYYTDLVTSRLTTSGIANQASVPSGFAADRTNSLDPNTARYDAIASQAVSNTYQFVQVPAQVSYEFRPRRKFGLAFLTGLVSNWFVKNTISESVTVKASDGIYRPVTMAGTAGVRLRYRTSRQWSASLAGTFQQNLQSLTQNDVSFQVLPQQMGLIFSVDKHF